MNLELIRSEVRNGKTLKEVSSNLKVSRTTLYKFLRKNNFSQQTEKFNHNFFDHIDSEDKAYWLGFIMADGCVSMTQAPKLTIQLATKDITHLEKFHESINSCIKIHYNPRTEKRFGSISSSHYSLKLCQDLISLGCTPKKSLTLKFPELPLDLEHHFVRGYFDGDGSIGWKNNHSQKQIVFCGTKEFLGAIKTKLEIKSNIRPKGNLYLLYISGNRQVDRIMQYMYKNASIFLERKRDIFAKLPV